MLRCYRLCDFDCDMGKERVLRGFHTNFHTVSQTLGWAAKILKIKQLAEKSDGYSIELFLGLFGGMGSLNDLVLNAPSTENDLLDAERRRGYLLATALK